MDDPSVRDAAVARHVRLHAGHARAPVRRVAADRAAGRPQVDDARRRLRGEAHRGDRHQAAGRLHRRRPGRRRDARGRPRDRRLLPGQGPAAGGAVDHQASRFARSARARRRGGALHADPHRGRVRHRDRAGRSRGRGALPRRERDRPGVRPRVRDRPGRPDGRLVRHGRLADQLRGDLARRHQPDEPGRQGPGRRRREATRGGHPRGAAGARARGARGEPRRPRRASRRVDRTRRAGPR